MLLKILDGLDFGDKLDSDGDLEIELYSINHDSVESRWINRRDAIKIAKHLIELFRLDVKEV